MRLLRITAPGLAAASVAFLVLMLLATAAYVNVADSALAKGSLMVGIAASSALAVVAGIVVNRPRRRDVWVLVGVAQAVGATGAGLWYAQLAADETQPPPGGPQDIFFIAFYVVFGAALVLALKRSELGGMAVLDAAIFAAGGMLLAFLVLVEPYFAMSDLSAVGRAVQVVRALADVCLLAMAVRLLMTPEAETPSLQLLAGAAFAWIASDLVWVWLTRIGGYEPGSSGDIGWLLAYALCGAAALHPSMTTVSAPRDPRPTVVRWPFYALLTAAMLAGSAVTAYGLLLDERIDSAGTVAITSVLSLVVIARLALLLRAEQRLRNELTARNEQLLELDEMKDSFVASVSHELRTPLTVIRGFTTTLLDRWPHLSEEDKLVFLRTIDGQGDRLNRLVETVLLLSKLKSGHVAALREPLDIADPARDAVEELGVDAGIEVNGETAPYVEGDPDQIHQIFVNLLVNARRYGAPPIRVQIESGDSNVTVRVSDEGDGVPADFVPHLFDAFTQSPHAGHAEGSGLGLAIVKGLVETSRGEVWYEPARPRGACFVVRFPRLGTPVATS